MHSRRAQKEIGRAIRSISGRNLEGNKIGKIRRAPPAPLTSIRREPASRESLHTVVRGRPRDAVEFAVDRLGEGSDGGKSQEETNMSVKCRFGLHDWKQNCERCSSCGRVRSRYPEGYHNWVDGKCGSCGASCSEKLQYELKWALREAQEQATSEATRAVMRGVGGNVEAVHDQVMARLLVAQLERFAKKYDLTKEEVVRLSRTSGNRMF